MSHSQDDAQRLPELVGYEMEVPEDFAAVVADRVEERTQIVILLEFVLVGLLLTVCGLFGLGGRNPRVGGKVSISEMMARAQESLMASLTDVVPKLLAVIVLLIAGLVVASIVRSLLRRFFAVGPWTGVFDRLGIGGALEASGYRSGPAQFISKAAYYVILAFFVRSIVDTLGLTTMSRAVGSALSFLPNLFAASVILLLGVFLARLAKGAVQRMAKGSDLPFSSALSQLASLAILAAASLIALAQLNINTAILERAATGLIWGLAVGVALTFGLGGRDIARNILAGFYLRRSYPPGTRVKLDGVQGQLVETTPLQTFIRSKDKVFGFPNDLILTKIIES